jgi:hypothetical protein
VVQAAEADAESKYLAGLGVARQRAAIVNGLRESVVSFSNEVEGTTSAQVMDMMVLTQVRFWPVPASCVRHFSVARGCR